MDTLIKFILWLLLFVFFTPLAICILIIKLIVYLVSGNKK